MENRKFKILAIDDTLDNLLVLKALVNEFYPNAVFLSANSGHQGLDFCINEQPDVVLLDIVMPDMDGFQVCKAIKKNPNTQSIPVIMITAAKTGMESKVRSLESGAEAFLTKPVDEVELRAQIGVMLRMKEAIDYKNKEKSQLEKLVLERTSMLEKELSDRKLTEEKLQTAIKSLEASKEAALNLMEDLQDEIIENQQTQNTLKESEERFRLVFENSPIGILSFDEKGIIHTCNNQFVKIIGSTQEKLIGLDMNMLPDQKVVAALKKALDGTISAHEGTYQSYTADKQTEVRLQFSPIFDSNGKVNGGVGMVEDISERILAETKRRELEERLRKSFYSSPVAISISTYEEGVFVDVNDAYCRLTGFTQEQLVGKNIIDLEIIGFDVRKLIKEELNSKGYIHEHEFTLKMRNKEKRVILVSIESYEMSGKKFMLSTLLDITERKQYEQELAKLSRAVEQSPVSIIITDLEGIIEYVNPKVTISTGYQPDELIGQNPRILKSGETPTSEYKTMFKVITMGDTWHGEFHNRKKSGELYWESATISPVINDMGVMTHYIAIKEDITEWKKLQNELIDNELRYRNIFIDNPMPMWIYDTESLLFVEVNNAAVNNYGYSKEEFIGMSIKDIRPKEDMEALLEDVANIKTQTEKPKLWRHIKKDGTVISVEIAAHSLPEQDGLKRRMVMANDVTDKLASQEALQKAKAMAEASDQLKTAFLNNISHEVRTPLNGILGATTMLNDPDIGREDLEELTDIINISTDRLLHTITDYMDISLITSNNMEVFNKEFGLNTLFNSLKNKHITLAEEKKLNLSISIPDPNFNPLIVSDEELIGKAMSHLVANAIKFTKEGIIEIGYTIADSFIELFVKDTGKGISADALVRVFSAFTQEDMSSSRRHEGSGLGLTIVKGIADLIGGEAKVESKQGVGSCFYFSIPYVNPNKPIVIQPPKSIAPPNETPKKSVILVAEDDDSNYIVLELLLRQMTISTVIRAINGQQAVEKCLANPEINFVLMDIKMPVMDGLEATKLIKAQLPDLTIVAITAYAMSGDEPRALAAGCDDYIAKPVSIKTLKSKIERYGVAMKPPKS